jgi:hypothetical protein
MTVFSLAVSASPVKRAETQNMRTSNTSGSMGGRLWTSRTANTDRERHLLSCVSDGHGKLERYSMVWRVYFRMYILVSRYAVSGT